MALSVTGNILPTPAMAGYVQGREALSASGEESPLEPVDNNFDTFSSVLEGFLEIPFVSQLRTLQYSESYSERECTTESGCRDFTGKPESETSFRADAVQEENAVLAVTSPNPNNFTDFAETSFYLPELPLINPEFVGTETQPELIAESVSKSGLGKAAETALYSEVAPEAGNIVLDRALFVEEADTSANTQPDLSSLGRTAKSSVEQNLSTPLQENNISTLEHPKEPILAGMEKSRAEGDSSIFSGSYSGAAMSDKLSVMSQAEARPARSISGIPTMETERRQVLSPSNERPVLWFSDQRQVRFSVTTEHLGGIDGQITQQDKLVNLSLQGTQDCVDALKANRDGFKEVIAGSFNEPLKIEVAVSEQNSNQQNHFSSFGQNNHSAMASNTGPESYSESCGSYLSTESRWSRNGSDSLVDMFA